MTPHAIALEIARLCWQARRMCDAAIDHARHARESLERIAP